MFLGNNSRIIQSLRESFSTVEDPRDPRGKRYHDFTEILILVVIGFLMGKNDFTNMAKVLRHKEEKLKQLLTLKEGIPSHDVFSDIMNRIDNEQLIFAVCDWFSMLAFDSSMQHIIIDGKGIRAAAEKNRDKKTPYVMNVLDSATKMVLMQLKVGEKTNEIKAIYELLDYLDVENTVITIDGIGTQKKIIKKIIDKGGNYLLPAKDNQSNLHSDIELYLDTEINNNSELVEKYDELTQRVHGRFEKRTYYSIKNHELELGEGFESVKTVGMVVRKVTPVEYDKDGNIKEGKEIIQRVCYISNLELDVMEFSKYIRDHWKIENSLHWVLDNTFREDRSTSRKGNSIENIALMRKAAYNILRIYSMSHPDESFEAMIDVFRDDVTLAGKYILEPIEITW